MLTVLAQSDSGGGAAAAGAALFLFLIYAVVIVVYIAGMWKAFEKAGQPGWAAIIPIYNIYIWTKIVGREAWWILLFLIPCVNIIAAVVLSIDMAKSFGKTEIYGIGLAFLGIIFWPMLGFGDSRYLGPAAGQPTAA